jgi:hypothetical protein
VKFFVLIRLIWFYLVQKVKTAGQMTTTTIVNVISGKLARRVTKKKKGYPTARRRCLTALFIHPSQCWRAD